MKIHSWRFPLAATLGLALLACGKPPAPEAVSEAAPPAAEASPATAVESSAAPLPLSPSAEGATVAILSPRDGDIVSSPVKVVMDLQGMALVAAGDQAPNSGHHHVLVDVAVPGLGQPIPKDAQHLHFGQGQTEADLALGPGQHTLRLLVGDGNHVPHNPPLISAPITITVQ